MVSYRGILFWQKTQAELSRDSAIADHTILELINDKGHKLGIDLQKYLLSGRIKSKKFELFVDEFGV